MCSSNVRSLCVLSFDIKMSFPGISIPKLLPLESGDPKMLWPETPTVIHPIGRCKKSFYSVG